MGCVYKVAPEKLSFGASGGAGSFTVTTVPSDCQWTVSDNWRDIKLLTTSGTGTATVSYQVLANAGLFDHEMRVQGLSGLNPPAIHTVSVR